MARPLRVPLNDLTPGVRRLDGSAARYVSRVHRLGVGDRLLLFDPARALEAPALIQQIARDHVSCLLERVMPSDYRPYPLVLVQGLGKGDKPDRTVAEATALGAQRVAFVHAARGIARPDGERAEARRQRWQRIAAEAARQSERGDLPAIDGPGELGPVLQELAGSCGIILRPGAPPLLSVLDAWAPGTSLALLVGPEGGFDDRELETADRSGLRPASLGAGVLRTELAGSAALAVGVAFAQAHAMVSTAKDG